LFWVNSFVESAFFFYIPLQSVKIIPDVYEAACRLNHPEEYADTDGECPTNVIIDHLIDMSHLLLAINSSANFVIYTWRGECTEDYNGFPLEVFVGLRKCLFE
jgi:hypothetical protein